MLNKKLALIAILFSMVCACSRSTPLPSPTNSKPLSNTPSPTIVEPTIAPVIIQPTARPEVDSRCQAERYRFIPINVFSQPDRRAQGFKYVLVRFAISNGSAYYGAPIGSDPGHGTLQGAFLTSEGGFVYGALFTPVYLDAEQPPFLGEVVSSVASGLIPPGFTINRVPSFWSDSFQLVFRVAQTQNHFTLSMPLDIQCARPDLDTTFYSVDKVILGQYFHFSESAGPITIDLNETSPTPIYGPDDTATVKDFPKSFEIPDSGTLEFLSVEYLEVVSDPNAPGYGKAPQIRLHFKFTNASAGYGTSGVIRGNLFGDDGLLRFQCGWGNYEAGPGLASEVSICFDNPSQAKHYYFAFEGVSPAISGQRVSASIYQVYKLPDANVGPIVTPTATLPPGTSVGDWAELAQQSEYFVVYPDDPIRPYVIVRNAGSNTWKAGIYGFSGRGEWVDSWSNGNLPRDVKPGDTIEFVNEQEISAPREPGRYDYGFMLVNDQGNEFGPYFFIRVDVVSKPENANAGELRLLGKLPVDPLKYQLNQQLSPAGYLDLLVVHSGRVFAKLYEILQALRTGVDILSEPDKIEAAFYEDTRTHACFVQITEYKDDAILQQGELFLVPCGTAPTPG